jgi:hypothetical protein
VEARNETLIVGKNRKRAFWALALVGFMILVSIVLLVTGLLTRSGILWTVVWLGIVGLVGFGGSAALIVHTMRSPWHLAVSPTHLRLHTPTYLVNVPWENVAAIAVDEVNWRPGCTLVFEDPATVAEGARFLARSSRPDIVADAGTMLARMKDCYDNLGYHLGIPGRILERGPEELAELLSKACSGQLWAEREGPR